MSTKSLGVLKDVKGSLMSTKKAEKICYAMNAVARYENIAGVSMSQVYRAKPIETSYDGVETYAINQDGYVFVVVWNIEEEKVEKADKVKMFF